MTSRRGVAGPTYVVTGSASGIGAATASVLCERGRAEVIGCDLDNAEVHANLPTPNGRRSLVNQEISSVRSMRYWRSWAAGKPFCWSRVTVVR